MKQRRILVVIGTRPEVVKTSRFVHLSRKCDEFDVHLCFTGQHDHLATGAMKDLEIVADTNLTVMTPNQSLGELTAKLVTRLSSQMAQLEPDLVVVQGDTTSAFCGALAAFYSRVPVAHIEAGLRTRSMYSPFPEEINRRLITTMSTFCFAPTESARRNLLSENIPSERIWVTGNTGTDALLWMADSTSKNGQQVSHRNDHHSVLVTAHRRESHGDGLVEICSAIRNFVTSDQKASVLFPVHQNPNVVATVSKELGDVERVNLIDPLGYRDFVTAMTEVDLILTDSGGVQEEAPYLGKYFIVLREQTERSEALDLGLGRIVAIDRKEILSAIQSFFSSPSLHQTEVSSPYGDGNATQRILDILKTTPDWRSP